MYDVVCVGVTIAHETHRARILYSPWVSYQLLQKHPDLHLVADIRYYQ